MVLERVIIFIQNLLHISLIITIECYGSVLQQLLSTAAEKLNQYQPSWREKLQSVSGEWTGMDSGRLLMNQMALPKRTISLLLAMKECPSMIDCLRRTTDLMVEVKRIESVGQNGRERVPLPAKECFH